MSTLGVVMHRTCNVSAADGMGVLDESRFSPTVAEATGTVLPANNGRAIPATHSSHSH